MAQVVIIIKDSVSLSVENVHIQMFVATFMIMVAR